MACTFVGVNGQRSRVTSGQKEPHSSARPRLTCNPQGEILLTTFHPLSPSHLCCTFEFRSRMYVLYIVCVCVICKGKTQYSDL
jgi:hypothetical protein